MIHFRFSGFILNIFLQTKKEYIRADIWKAWIIHICCISLTCNDRKILKLEALIFSLKPAPTVMQQRLAVESVKGWIASSMSSKTKPAPVGPEALDTRPRLKNTTHLPPSLFCSHLPGNAAEIICLCITDDLVHWRDSSAFILII